MRLTAALASSSVVTAAPFAGATSGASRTADCATWKASCACLSADSACVICACAASSALRSTTSAGRGRPLLRTYSTESPMFTMVIPAFSRNRLLAAGHAAPRVVIAEPHAMHAVIVVLKPRDRAKVIGGDLAGPLDLRRPRDIPYSPIGARLLSERETRVGRQTQGLALQVLRLLAPAVPQPVGRPAYRGRFLFRDGVRCTVASQAAGAIGVHPVRCVGCSELGGHLLAPFLYNARLYQACQQTPGNSLVG